MHPLSDHMGLPYFGYMPSLEREISDFNRDVLLRSQQRFVLAEFWAPWCTTCTHLRPALERAAARFVARLDLVSVNIEMHAQVLDVQGVFGLPTVKAYFMGRAIGEMTGILPEPAIERWIDSLFDAARKGGLLPAPSAAGPTEASKRPAR